MYKIYNNEIKITNLLKGGSSNYQTPTKKPSLLEQLRKESENTTLEEYQKKFRLETETKAAKLLQRNLTKLEKNKQIQKLEDDIEKLTELGNDLKTKAEHYENAYNECQTSLQESEKKGSETLKTFVNVQEELDTINNKIEEDEKKINGLKESLKGEGVVEKKNVLEKINELDLSQQLGGAAMTSKLTDEDIKLPNDGKEYKITDHVDQQKIKRNATDVQALINNYDWLPNEEKKEAMTFILTYLKMIKVMEDDQLLSFEDFETKHLNKNSATKPETQNLNDFFKKNSFKNLIGDVDKFLKKHPNEKSECIKFVMKLPLLQNVPGVKAYPFRQMQGGLYQNLEYVLNGGAMTLIRVPSSIDNYRRQLKIIKIRLENSNKKLSAVTEQRITNVIDKIAEHEKNLKDQLELLFYGSQVEGDDVDITTTENKEKLEKAKKTYRKTKRYNTVADTIFNRLAEVLKDNFDVQPKSTAKTY
jgi:chromosome segregation ATPase